MPTKPFQTLLYPEMRKAEAKQVIDEGSSLLRELINYATNAFPRCQASASKETPDEHLPVFASFYHIIEMTDAIEVLISESCAIPAMPLLRSSFEALLAIEYILEANYSNRAFAWQVCYVHQRLHNYKILNPSTQEGKQFQSLLEKDTVGKYIKAHLGYIPDLASYISNLESLLDKPSYKAANTEYEALKKRRSNRPEWYSFNGGPSSIRGLAQHLGRGAQYEIMYRSWSSISHGTDLSHILAKANDGSAAINPIRNHQYMVAVIGFAAEFMLHATRVMLGKFRPGEKQSVRNWYIRDVRKKFLAFMVRTAEAIK